MSKYAIILLGPPGSGKTTISDRLVAHTGRIGVIKTGQLLRSEEDKGTPLGQKLKPFLEKGNLAPVDLVAETVAKAVRHSQKTIMLFDGFPRNEAQIEPFFDLIQAAGRVLAAALVLTLADSVALKRLTGRRICPNCGAIYNIHFDPPSQPGVCDRCGASLEQREDDTPAVVKQRLTVYEQQTMPVVAYFDHNHPELTHTISAQQPVEQVVGDILSILKERDENLERQSKL